MNAKEALELVMEKELEYKSHNFNHVMDCIKERIEFRHLEKLFFKTCCIRAEYPSKETQERLRELGYLVHDIRTRGEDGVRIYWGDEV